MHIENSGDIHKEIYNINIENELGWLSIIADQPLWVIRYQIPVYIHSHPQTDLRCIPTLQCLLTWETLRNLATFTSGWWHTTRPTLRRELTHIYIYIYINLFHLHFSLSDVGELNSLEDLCIRREGNVIFLCQSAQLSWCQERIYIYVYICVCVCVYI